MWDSAMNAGDWLPRSIAHSRTGVERHFLQLKTAGLNRLVGIAQGHRAGVDQMERLSPRFRSLRKAHDGSGDVVDRRHFHAVV